MQNQPTKPITDIDFVYFLFLYLFNAFNRFAYILAYTHPNTSKFFFF